MIPKLAAIVIFFSLSACSDETNFERTPPPPKTDFTEDNAEVTEPGTDTNTGPFLPSETSGALTTSLAMTAVAAEEGSVEVSWLVSDAEVPSGAVFFFELSRVPLAELAAPTCIGTLLGQWTTIDLPPSFADTAPPEDEDFFYRMCVTDMSGQVQWFDSNPVTVEVAFPDDDPLVAAKELFLDGFTATPALVSGAIDLNVDFPDNPVDIGRVEIWRSEGTLAPAADCSEPDSGELLRSYTVGEFTDDQFTDSGLTVGSNYNYRACLFDLDGVVSSVPTPALFDITAP